MNEQIFIELRDEAFSLTEWEELNYDNILKKFGELIVKRCAEQIRLQGTDWMDWQPSQQGIRPEHAAMAEHIKQHFGVTE